MKKLFLSILLIYVFAIQSIYAAVNKNFDMRVKNLISELDLLRPIYLNLASYGHMGREELNVPFERWDKVDKLKEYLK